jgi:DNA-binding GntR family transcriptional regulator
LRLHESPDEIGGRGAPIVTVKNAGNLVDQLVDHIQTKIAAGEYAPGQKLRQAALASTFKVSRTPIRQALSQLVALGLVDDDSASGVIVKSQTPKEVRDIYRVRAEIEGLAAELAAQWITDRELHDLREIHEKFVRAVSLLHEAARDQRSMHAEHEAVRKAWIASNGEFHAVINRASCNEYVQRIIADLHLGSTRGLVATSALGMYRHRMEKNIAHHHSIIAALEARDPGMAKSTMMAHVIESGEFVASWLEIQTRA